MERFGSIKPCSPLEPSIKPARTSGWRKHSPPPTETKKPSMKSTIRSRPLPASSLPKHCCANRALNNLTTSSLHQSPPETLNNKPNLMSTTTTQTLDASQIQERIVRFRQVREAIIQQIHNVIIGQDEVIEQVLIALFVGGHCLIT